MKKAPSLLACYYSPPTIPLQHDGLPGEGTQPQPGSEQAPRGPWRRQMGRPSPDHDWLAPQSLLSGVPSRLMLSPHNSISKKFLLHFDYVYRISLVWGKMQSHSQCVSAWAVAVPGTALPAGLVSRAPRFGGSRKDLPRSSRRKPVSTLLVPQVQSHGGSGFPRPTATGVLRPVLEGKEKIRDQRYFLRPAGCWKETGQSPFFYLVPMDTVQGLSNV